MQVLLNDEFYDVMGSDHVALVPLGVAEVTETGIIDSEGHSHDVDAIVWATGKVDTRDKFLLAESSKPTTKHPRFSCAILCVCRLQPRGHV